MTFRASQTELRHLSWRHLAFGLLCTWLVGMGRYWDNPRVSFWQHLGVGSIIYVFLLSLFLWLIIWPLRPRHWSYFTVLTFVSLASPPAAIYAFPIEQFVSLGTANSVNAWFLAIVAAWRVALLVFFLRRLGELGWFSIIIATLLPLTIIVTTLAILNLEKVVFNMMGGRRDPSPNDDAYEVLMLLTWAAFLIFIPLVIMYVVLIIEAVARSRRAASILRDGAK